MSGGRLQNRCTGTDTEIGKHRTEMQIDDTLQQSLHLMTQFSPHVYTASSSLESLTYFTDIYTLTCVGFMLILSFLLIYNSSMYFSVWRV